MPSLNWLMKLDTSVRNDPYFQIGRHRKAITEDHYTLTIYLISLGVELIQFLRISKTFFEDISSWELKSGQTLSAEDRIRKPQGTSTKIALANTIQHYNSQSLQGLLDMINYDNLEIHYFFHLPLSLAARHHSLTAQCQRQYLKTRKKFLAPSGALIAIPTYYWPTPTFSDLACRPLYNNIGLSLSEPLQLYQKQSLDSSAGYMYTLCAR